MGISEACQSEFICSRNGLGDWLENALMSSMRDSKKQSLRYVKKFWMSVDLMEPSQKMILDLTVASGRRSRQNQSLILLYKSCEERQ